MIGSLTSHLGDLAETLNDLRRRLRHAARVEVARAVGEALREAALTLFCGSSAYVTPRAAADSIWDDPWRDPGEDPWHANVEFGDEPEMMPTGSEARARSLQAAIVLGGSAARWVFYRTRRVLIAVLIGATVGILVIMGGPTIEACLAVWCPAHDLLRYSSPNL